MSNRELSRVFEEMAELMEISGADRFRINATHKISRIIDELPDDVAAMLASGALAEVDGIGAGTLARVKDYVERGVVADHQKLRASLPAGLLEMMTVAGLGPKTVALVWKELGVDSVAALQKAIDDGRLLTLKGMGAKKVEALRDAIAFHESAKGRTPLGPAREIGVAVRETLRRIEGVVRAELAGSLRRSCETIGDVDVLVATDDGERVLKTFVESVGVRKVLACGATKASVMWGDDDASAIQVDVRAVTDETFGAAWQYFTGSKEHNVRLRERAVKRGWKLNEYGLFDGEKCIASADEKEIYASLELAFVEPELREDRGEIDAAATNTLPKLLTIDDMRGDLHMHTTASDGELTIEGMIEACIARGYDYMCITDHSASLAVANGLSDDRLRQHVVDVRRAAKKYEKQIAVYIGSEVDILSDGRLDYDEALLSELDIVTASVHVAQNQSREITTDRIKRAMECRAVRIIGHLTGRLIGARPAMEMDVAELIRHAEATKTCLELNASWQRLDLNDVNLRLAKSHGVKITISTDAHCAEHLDSMALGVYTARRGWLEKCDVVNAMSRAAFDEWVRAGK